MNEKQLSVASIEERLDEIARLLALNIKRDRSLQDAISELASVGFRPTRIAELVGTSPGYVNVAVRRAKQRSSAAKAQQQEEN